MDKVKHKIIKEKFNPEKDVIDIVEETVNLVQLLNRKNTIKYNQAIKSDIEKGSP